MSSSKLQSALGCLPCLSTRVNFNVTLTASSLIEGSVNKDSWPEAAMPENTHSRVIMEALCSLPPLLVFASSFTEHDPSNEIIPSFTTGKMVSLTPSSVGSFEPGKDRSWLMAICASRPSNVMIFGADRMSSPSVNRHSPSLALQ